MYTEDGILEGYDAETLNLTIGIEGWAETLEKVGWLTVEAQRLIVPRFEEHNGASAKRRADDSQRKRRVRKMSAKRPQSSGQNADQIREKIIDKREDNKDTIQAVVLSELPDSLNTPEFSEAWNLWKKHRVEIKHPLKPTMASQQLAKFEEWGVERSIAAIRFTVLKGWQGIKEPDEQPSNFQRPKKDFTIPQLHD
jgi:hypothetical protein